MKVKKQIKKKSLPTDTTIGWKHKRPVVRMTVAQLAMAEMLGIPPKVYAQELLNMKFNGGDE